MIRNGELPGPGRRITALWLAWLVLALAGGQALQAKDPCNGFVSGSVLREIGGDEAIAVEVSIGEALLSIFSSFDPELGEIVGGLTSVHLLVLDMSRIEQPPKVERAVNGVKDLEQRLLKEGWERIAVVRDEEEIVSVLLLTCGDVIGGLTVMVIEESEGTLVFTNIAGIIDLARIGELTRQLGLPGLKDLHLEKMGEDQEE